VRRRIAHIVCDSFITAPHPHPCRPLTINACWFILLKVFSTSFALLGLTNLIAQAGDAVAIGYNDKGIWTALMYYCSGTPKGGSDYKDAAAAREAALKDLKKRAGEQQATSKIIFSSDKTGHFAVASARASKADETQPIFAVGYGKSKEISEKDAFHQLAREKATEKKKVHYHYFSHGEDGK